MPWGKRLRSTTSCGHIALPDLVYTPSPVPARAVMHVPAPFVPVLCLLPPLLALCMLVFCVCALRAPALFCWGQLARSARVSECTVCLLHSAIVCCVLVLCVLVLCTIPRCGRVELACLCTGAIDMMATMQASLEPRRPGIGSIASRLSHRVPPIAFPQAPRGRRPTRYLFSLHMHAICSLYLRMRN